MTARITPITIPAMAPVVKPPTLQLTLEWEHRSKVESQQSVAH